MKCKKGYKQVGNRCVRKKYFGEFRDGIPQKNKNVRYLAIATLFILTIVLIINISDSDTVKPLLISIVFLIIPLIVYSIKEYQDDLMGLEIKTIPINLLWGVIFVGLFFLITSIVPFFTLAYPKYPNAIGENLRWILVVILAPITETLFFQSTIFAFIRNFAKKYPKKYKYWFILIVSILFSMAHVGAYILGFYQLDITEGFTAFTSNLSAFITAFLFSFIAMVFALRNGVERANISFILIFHLGLNLIAYGLSVITFAIIYSLL